MDSGTINNDSVVVNSSQQFTKIVFASVNSYRRIQVIEKTSFWCYYNRCLRVVTIINLHDSILQFNKISV